MKYLIKNIRGVTNKLLPLIKIFMANKFNPQPKKGLPQKKPKQPLKRVPVKKRSTKTINELKNEEGMLKFFIDIWNSRKAGNLFVAREYATVEEWREHTSQYRVCCVTYQPIVNMVPANFMHVLTKNKTKAKKDPNNICMGTYETHQIQEFQLKSKLIEHGPGGFWFNEYKQLMKEQYEFNSK